ncbi:cytochrome P450 family protein [Ceratobasidium sp. AG-Ba]|nr:cytochrome P450 family protein [Ceratobasidium sp. AG-Ba]
MSKSIIPGVLIAGAASTVFYSWYKSRHSVPLPPGPTGNFLLGNALDLASVESVWLKFAEYTDEYGPLTTVRIINQNMFLIDDPHLVSELFEKRAANYSDKVVSEMAKLIGWDKDILLLPYGPLLKRYRTMLNRALNNRVALDYIPLQQKEVQKFMKRLTETPDDFMTHVRLLASSIAIRIGYGYEVGSYDDPLVQTAEEHMAHFSECLQYWKWMVDIFPLLRLLPSWLPIAPFQRRAREANRVFTLHRDRPFEYVKQQMAAGTAEDSFTSKLLLSEDGKPVDEETEKHVRCIAATLYAAGSDTTVSIVQSFFLAMALYPEIQAKAQAEIDSFLNHSANEGTHRMLHPRDRPNLPYTSALVRELFRWHPVVTLDGHRSSHQDDLNVVSGGKAYRIPARSSLIANLWKIMHNPEVYEQPETFMPERYLSENPPPDPENYAFGFGRRICPGMHIAQQSVWISISNLLANFTVTKARDENGVEIIPEERYTSGIVSHPFPFQCTITPKSGMKEWIHGLVE